MIAVVLSEQSFAAEWKSEPSIFMKMQYDDNVRMRTEQNNPEGSTGYTLEPRVKFKGEELNLWDVSIDVRGRITRFQDVEDADSENVFFVFNGGRQTELTDWRLNANYESNTNFDTDFETSPPDSGLLLDDRTDRTTRSISPSVTWLTSEISQLSFSISSTDVAYDEVSSQAYKDYDYDSAQFSAFWGLAENHQLGFTTAYSEYDSPEANSSWNNTELSFDYTYTINQISSLSLSLGGRRLESLLEDVIVACVNPGEFELFGGCPSSAPILGDIDEEDTGTVTDVSYTNKSETVSHKISGGRSVIPSSFGGAQEERRLSYFFDMRNTERFSTRVILSGSETQTLSGIDSSNDRTHYRIEPSIIYKLNKNWKISVLYRYIEQNLTNSDEDSASNAIFVNLFLHWPRLTTTY